MKLTRRRFLRGLALLPWLVLPDLTRAQGPEPNKLYFPIIRGSDMVAPSTLILDNFNRPDEGPPPSAAWFTPVGADGMVVDTLQVTADPLAAAGGEAAWNSIYGPNTEVFATLSALDDGQDAYIFLGSNGLSPGDPSWVGYLLGIGRNDGGNDGVTVLSQVGTVIPVQVINLVLGDAFWLRHVNGQLTVYQKHAAGDWTVVASVANSDAGSGYLGLATSDKSAHFEDFGGGTVSDEPWTPTAVTITTHCAEDPILALVCSNGDRLDLITWEAGFELDDPGWRPQVAQFKGGGSYANSQIAEGQTLVAAEYDNVVETIPLVGRGTDEAKCIQTYRRLQQFIKRASDYWKEPSEYDCVWLEVRPTGKDCRTGYARVSKAACGDFANPFGQPFFSQQAYSVADGLTLVVEREPLWRAVPPGEIVGPLYNLLKNPDFEDWNSGVADSQPDCWTDLETFWIVGDNSRDDSPKWGRYCLKVHSGGSVQANGAKGVTQTVEGVEDGQEYTVVGWIRNGGVTNGVGRLLVTSLLGQYEVYRGSTRHGWELHTFTFTAGIGDVIGVNCEILSTAAGCDGEVFFDSLMVLKGDWEEEAIAEVLPYMSSSHIYNHVDTGAGHLNYVDCWEVPGDVDSLIRLEVVNNRTPADYTNVVEKIGKLHVGQRRTGDVQNFQDYHDPAGVVDTSASNADRVNFTPTPDWVDLTTHSVIGVNNTPDNVGRFRVLTRLYDAKGSGNPTLEARLLYWIGVSQAGVKYLSGVTIPQRATWNMVNLTPNAAQILDSKFRANFPGALSYTVQIRRPTGTGDARFDYALQLPTDGGFLEASISPGMEMGVSLVVDNTNSSSITATGTRRGYMIRYQPSTAFGILAFQSFNGLVYAGADETNKTRIFRRSGGTWSQAYLLNNYGDVKDFALFNGKLYATQGHPAAFDGGAIGTADGISWSPEVDIAAINVNALESFNGYLWIAGYNYNGEVTTTKIHRWDGSALITSFSIILGGGASFRDFETYAGKMYAATTNGLVYVYNPITDSWSLSFNSGETSGYKLQSFGGKLYFGTGNAGNLYVYDGATWSLVTSFADDGMTDIQCFTVHDNKLCLGGSVSSAVLNSSDGVTFEKLYDAEAFYITALGSFDGDLYIGTWNFVGGFSYIYVIVADEAVEYSVANYQMGGGQNGGFTAPNRRLRDDERRHRWVFSCDRSDGSNAIGDLMLVGIGYVPRYLGLLGEG